MLTRMNLEGFKCFKKPTEIPFSKLTIMGGKNSSGKSSSFQPLLLLKQTFEAGYNVDVFRIDGDATKYTSAEQFFTKARKSATVSGNLFLELEWSNLSHLPLIEEHNKSENPIKVKTVLGRKGNVSKILKTEINASEYSLSISQDDCDESGAKRALEKLLKQVKLPKSLAISHSVKMHERFASIKKAGPFLCLASWNEFLPGMKFEAVTQFAAQVEPWAKSIVYLPGLRHKGDRLYSINGVPKPLYILGKQTTFYYPGRFDDYFVSLLADTGEVSSNKVNLNNITLWLEKLGLTGKLKVEKLDSVNVEIKVGVGNSSGTSSLVSIADVGVGVSQVLPLLVALEVANLKSTLIIEQPELHLHPEAQLALAGIIVSKLPTIGQLIIETHSEVLLLGLQAEVAAGRLKNTDLQVNWFERDSQGWSSVNSLRCNTKGFIENSPIDYPMFRDVALKNLLFGTNK